MEDSRVVTTVGSSLTRTRNWYIDQEGPLQVHWVGVGGLLGFIFDHLVLLALTSITITMGALQVQWVRVGGLTCVLFIFVHLLSFPESSDN